MKCFYRQFDDFRPHRLIYGFEDSTGPENLEAVVDTGDLMEESQEGTMDDQAEERKAEMRDRIALLARDVEIDSPEGSGTFKELLREAETLLNDEQSSQTMEALDEAESKIDLVQRGLVDGIDAIMGEAKPKEETPRLSSPSTLRIDAEHTRIGTAMVKLAERNAWSGVDRAYDELVELVGKNKDIKLTCQDHFLGAQASQASGDLNAMHQRLLAASAAPVDNTNPDAMLALDSMGSNFFEGSLSVPKKYSGNQELTISPMPFEPDKRAFVLSVIQSVEDTGEYKGLLPRGLTNGSPFELKFGDLPPVTIDGNTDSLDLALESSTGDEAREARRAGKEEARGEKVAQKEQALAEREADRVAQREADEARTAEQEQPVEASKEDIDKGVVFSSKLADAYRSGDWTSVETYLQRISALPGVDPSREVLFYAADSMIFWSETALGVGDAALAAEYMDLAQSRYDQAMSMPSSDDEEGVGFQAQAIASIQSKFDQA